MRPVNSPELESAPSGVAGAVEAVRSGRMRVGTFLERHIERFRQTHEKPGGGINALVQPRHEAARAEAALVEPGPGGLAGVMASVKDCFAVEGLTTTLGIAARRGRRDEACGEIVRRLREAGAVVVGKSNVSQAMFQYDADNPVWGRTNHPERPDRGPGGSSGGDAALVAAGVVPLAVGNDLAGSMRQPAHACGVASILPSSSALGGCGGFETMPHLACLKPRAGFFARSVEDLAIVLDVMLHHPPGSSGPAERAGPIRVGWWEETGPIPPSAAVRRGVREAVAALVASGLAGVPVPPTVADEAAWLHVAILSSDGGRSIRRVFEGERPIRGVARSLRLAAVPGPLRRGLAALASMVGRRIEADALLATGPRSARGFEELLVRREAVRGRLAREWRDAEGRPLDAVVCPVFAVPALPHGMASELLIAGAPCFLASLLDLPAGVVPVTRVRADETGDREPSGDPVLRAAGVVDAGSGGLPIGVQVIAADGRESTLLEVMRAVERGLPRPWHRDQSTSLASTAPGI